MIRSRVIAKGILMASKIDLNQVYVLSEDVVVREIEGELIIVPIAAGIGDMEDELYTMNETGKLILSKIDGEQSLADIVEDLALEYDASLSEIERDVLGLVNELAKRKMIKLVE
jgi:hypothetical protein